MSEISRIDASSVHRPLHILVVEDNPDVRDTLRILLELYGYEVDVAADGLIAVEMACRLHPDAALVDIGLPRLDGHQVARFIRLALGSTVRLMACTAYNDAETRQHALAAGFDAFQVKPVDPELIVSWLTESDEE